MSEARTVDRAPREPPPSRARSALVALAALVSLGLAARDPLGMLASAGPARWATAAAVGVLVAGFAAWPGADGLVRSRGAWALGVLALPLFWAFRTHFVNADGLALPDKIASAVPLHGALLTHDELLETWLHSRFWVWTHARYGWSVSESYVALACVAGCAWVGLAFRLAPRLSPRAPALALAGLLTGGFVELWFGDVENYGLLTLAVAGFLLASLRFLAGESGISGPVLSLALAMAFHLEAGFLIPALVVLLRVSRDRAGPRPGTIAVVIAAAFGAGLLAWFHGHGLPLWRLLDTHAAMVADPDGFNFSVGMPAGYYLDQLGLLVVLAPALLPLAAGWGRVGAASPHARARFFAVAAGTMLAFQLGWRAQLGVHGDWNLYAMGGLVMTAAAWSLEPERWVGAVIAGLGAAQTVLWVGAGAAATATPP